MKYHFVPVRMVTIKKTKGNKGVNKMETLYPVAVVKLVWPLRKTL